MNSFYAIPYDVKDTDKNMLLILVAKWSETMPNLILHQMFTVIWGCM
jgi:hypothetical protein